MLVARGADLSLADDRGQTPLHCLAALGHQHHLFFIRGITNCFASPKVDVSAPDHEGDTPMQIAARTGTSDVLNWLVRRGRAWTRQTRPARRPLAGGATRPTCLPGPARFRYRPVLRHRAGQTGGGDRVLKTNPALVNHTNRFGQTPLRLAVQARRTNIVEFLAQQRRRVDPVAAALAGRAGRAPGMLAREPAIITNTLNGNTLLHLAAAHGNLELTRLLLGAGARPAVQNAGAFPRWAPPGEKPGNGSARRCSRRGGVGECL